MKRLRKSIIVFTLCLMLITSGLFSSCEVLDNNTAADIINIIPMVGSDNTQIYISWYSTSPSLGCVEWGIKSDATGDSFPNTYITFKAFEHAQSNLKGYTYNHALITGLIDNTEYVYRVSNSDGQSSIYDYTTQDFDGSFNFLFAADPQIELSSHILKWDITLKKSLLYFPKTSFILIPGDQIESCSSEKMYGYFLKPNSLRNIAISTNVGNNDYGSSIYSEHFVVPNASIFTDGVCGKYGADYWFIQNNVLFLSLDSNVTDVSLHEKFMKQVLDKQRDKADWIVATLHHSIFSVAQHSNDEKIIELRKDLAPVLSKLGVDVALMGHDHCYTRTYMMDSIKPIITSKVESYVINPPFGEVLYITGNSSSGSKFYYTNSGKFPYAAVTSQQKESYISNVEVTYNSFTITTYCVNDMSIIDKFTIYKDNELIID